MTEQALGGGEGRARTAGTTSAAPMPGELPNAPRRRYALFVASFLAVVYSFNFMDRQILSILQEQIRQEMGLTDTQLGLLSGLSFALFYTTFGIPVAWLSDRHRRVTIMATACAVWSLATAACGLARGFTQLAMARVLVGAGEAGGSPPSYSLISDYFPPERRGTGLAIYSLGVPVGSALGVALGGWMAAHYGWRAAFVAVGLPGLLIALLMLLLVREPKRGGLDPGSRGVPAPALPLGQVLARFARDRTLMLTAVSAGLSSFVGYALLAWNPSFLERVKGMSLADVAGTYSLLLGITGVVGTLGAGRLVDRLGERDVRWYAWLPALVFLLELPAFLGFLWAPDRGLSLIFLTILALLGNAYLAPALALVQNTAPPAQRSVAGASLLFLLNLIGLGGGPLFVGRVSDIARAHGAAQPLLIGFAALIPIIVLTIILYLFAAASLARRDTGNSIPG